MHSVFLDFGLTKQETCQMRACDIVITLSLDFFSQFEIQEINMQLAYYEPTNILTITYLHICDQHGKHTIIPGENNEVQNIVGRWCFKTLPVVKYLIPIITFII